MAAAVADWRVANASGSKMKKDGTGQAPALEFAENPDILARVSKGLQRPKLVVGFAAETDRVDEYAAAKRLRKGCDWIVANDVSPATGIMGGDRERGHADHRRRGRGVATYGQRMRWRGHWRSGLRRLCWCEAGILRKIPWDGSDVRNGLWTGRMRSGGDIFTQRMTMTLVQVMWEDWADRSVALPAYQTAGAAGADICANLPQADRAAGIVIAPMGRVVVPTGIRVAISAGYEMQIRPRSGLAVKFGITLTKHAGHD